MESEKSVVRIYSDGSCRGNPGAGGWGAVILYIDEPVVELSGGDPSTTNNRMELLGAIEALEHVSVRRGGAKPEERKTLQVHCTTDSKYVKDGITLWIKNWVKKAWLTSKGKPVANQELWRRLHELDQELSVQWHWVKAHNGHPQNERADRLAKAAVPHKSCTGKGK
jgi:ribonuclease HI/DNA polymerase-3 subunit epsilon